MRVVPPARLAHTTARWASDFEHGTRIGPETGEPGRRPWTFSIGIGGSARSRERAADCSDRRVLTYSLAHFAHACATHHEIHSTMKNDVYLGRDVPVGKLEQIASGKVRDIYAIDAKHLLFVTTDRVSAFDVVMKEGIPHKGAVLTAISAWWFENTRDVVENHLVSTSVEDLKALDARTKDRLRGRIMIVKRAQPTSVEWVVRGYLAGSGW